MQQIHIPPGFGSTPKAHIHRHNGEWFASFPANWPIHPPYAEAFVPFLRRLNGISDWRPTSFFVERPERIQ